MNTKENILRTIRFDRPDYIPTIFHINESCWEYYPTDALKELMDEHRFLFSDFEGGPGSTELNYSVPERVGKPFTDGWGCVWETTMDGIVGVVVKHPLASWDNFDNYTTPDPQVDSGKGVVDWEKVRQDIDSAKANGQFGQSDIWATGRLSL